MLVVIVRRGAASGMVRLLHLRSCWPRRIKTLTAQCRAYIIQSQFITSQL